MSHTIIKQIHPDEFGTIRKLDREAFQYNERGSNGDLHEVFADNIRRSPYYIPELDLVAVMDDGFTYLGHAVFSALPMGDNGEHIVWLNCLAVRHGEKDSHAEKTYEYQRKGIGRALVKHGLEIAKSLGYTGCMTCGNPEVYQKKMGFHDCRELGIDRDISVDDPEGCVFAIELIPGGFDKTNKLLSYAYYDFTTLEQIKIKPETLTKVLSKMLGTNIIRAVFQLKQLQGGTLGDVRLVSGMAETANGRKLPYKVVFKTQKKWVRPGDPQSWHREYDLYISDFKDAFTDSLCWPECYHAEMNNDEIQIWMEYIDGISGKDLDIEALEQAAEALGHFQGKIYQQHETLKNITCLGDTGFMEREFGQWKPETAEYRYLHSDECTLPEHLRRMLVDTQRQAEMIFSNISCLPVVLCHRDLWIENIFITDARIFLIDWDCTGWGFMGEDIASLIADDFDYDNLDEYYRRFIPAYIRGISEYIDVSAIEDFYIWEMIVIKFGYRFLQGFMFSQSSDVKEQQINALQKLYEIKKAKDTPIITRML